MAEKRFTKQEVYNGVNKYQINESNFIIEILDDGIPMHYSTIVNRLNEQHKTITRLKKENDELKQVYTQLKHRHSLLHDVCIDAEYDRDSYRKDIASLEKENEQLKHDAIVLICSNQEYRKENEQLKFELKVYRKIANCNNCEYHNYDWDINDGYGGEEYEVCDKGNDMSDRICEDWEEL